MLRRVALVRTSVSEEFSTSIIRAAKIGELGKTLDLTSNRRTLQRNTCISSQRASVASYGYVRTSPILVTLMREALVPPKRQFLQEPHGVTSQKTPFFKVTAVKTSNLTK
jgi:hypothetical protein